MRYQLRPMQITRNRQRAVDAFADQLAQQGRQYANSAHSVRAGYRNMWITAGIDALERVICSVPDDEGEDPEDGRPEAAHRAARAR